MIKLSVDNLCGYVFKEIVSQTGTTNKSFGIQVSLSFHTSIYLVTLNGKEKTFVFSPEGKQLAVAHYNSI